jgi:TonB-linked SusC/RagA family outer membrane protein
MKINVKFLGLCLFVWMQVNFLVAQVLPKVEGVVLDENGESIIGASVLVKGTSKGIVTDMDGKFVLQDVKSGAIVSVSYVGMTTAEVKAAAKMKVVLTSNTEVLDEVVVVAFGEQKKSSFTGSAGVVGGEKLATRQLTNVMDALSGSVAGVQTVSSSGSPDATPTIRVRGISSISAGNDPLIIVDGAPYEGGWNNLNPSDVASVTVLKDAASNALYGARGANGVILVTTKKADAGNAVITLDAKWGNNHRIVRDYQTIRNVGQYYETHYAALYNYNVNSLGLSQQAANAAANAAMGKSAADGGLGYIVYSVPENQNLIGTNGKLNPQATLGNRIYNNGQVYTLLPDDWVDEAYRNATRAEYNLNISGGNEKTQYYASLGYLSNQGVVSNSDYERYTARFKATYQAKKWLRTGANLNFSHSTSNGVNTNSNSLFYTVNSVAPIYPLYIRDAAGNIMTDENGKMYDYGEGAEIGLTRPVMQKNNPLNENSLNKNRTNGNAFTLNGFADITPLEGLKITLNGSVTDLENRYTYTQQPFYGLGATSYPGGYVGKASGRTYTLNFQQIVNYTKEIGDHHISLMVGHENYKYDYEYLYGSRINMASYFGNQTLSGAVTIDNTYDSNSDYNNEGFFFRGQYDWKEKYFGSVSYRRDASSRFHPDNRWGDFFSFGGAWIVSKESWFKSKAIDMLKVKASFGQQGNDNIGDYLYTDLYSINNVDGSVGLSLKQVGNKNITWETNNNLNLGVEFELWKSRLTGNVEFFYRKTTDMLSFVKVPTSSGYNGSYANVGDMVNKGVEIELNGTILRGKGYSWNVNANTTIFKNEITKLSEDNKGTTVSGHSGYTSDYYFYGEGLPIYTWYMPRYAGVNEEGLSTWYTADGNTTTAYGDAAQLDCGTALADLYGGFGTDFSFKGFTLGVNFTYSIGGKGYDFTYASMMTNPISGTTGASIHKDVLKAWTTENNISDIPRWQYGDANVGAYSSRFLTDASYLTLQNINLGYNLPKNFVRKLALSNVRIYASGENLYYWSKRKGFDPRTSFKGATSQTEYSPTRTISGGINIQF